MNSLVSGFTVSQESSLNQSAPKPRKRIPIPWNVRHATGMIARFNSEGILVSSGSGGLAIMRHVAEAVETARSLGDLLGVGAVQHMELEVHSRARQLSVSSDRHEIVVNMLPNPTSRSGSRARIPVASRESIDFCHAA